MAEIRENIRLDELPAICRQIGVTNNPTAQEDVAYMTDLAWRRKWQKAGEVVHMGAVAGTIFDAAVTQSSLVISRGEIEGKPQPSYVESLVETERRLDFLHQYLPHLPENVLGVVSGGSMSYGRFNNVRAGYPDSSDLDLMFVIDRAPKEEDIDQLVRTDLGFSRQDLATFRGRLPVFEEGSREGTMDVLSQKFTLPNKGFDVSTHFIPKSVIERFMDRDLKADIQAGGDVDVRLISEIFLEILML
jgi:hypothetical protein